MFPDDFLRNTAREAGVVERERKIDVVVLFGVTTLEFGVRFLSAIRGLKRKYEEHAKKRFKDLVIQDRTIIRLHESLAKIWPAARKRELIHAFTLGKCVYATSRPIIN